MVWFLIPNGSARLPSTRSWWLRCPAFSCPECSRPPAIWTVVSTVGVDPKLVAVRAAVRLPGSVLTPDCDADGCLGSGLDAAGRGFILAGAARSSGGCASQFPGTKDLPAGCGETIT